MRRINLLFVIGMLLSFLAHSIIGGIRLSGAEAGSPEVWAWICLSFVSLHTVTGAILTVKTLVAIRRSGKGYFKENKLFWTRRISGFALLIPLLMHLLIFSGTGDEAYRLVFFHSGRLISQLLLIAVLALHVLTNVRTTLIGLGVRSRRLFSADICFVLSVVLLLCCCAFCIYYLRWMSY